MRRFELRPGWVVSGLLLAAAMAAGGLWTLRIAGQQAAKTHVERLGGHVGVVCLAPEWLRARLPESWRWPFDSIEQVELSYRPLTNADLESLVARLRPLPGLRGLHLTGTKIDDAAAPRIARLKQLRGLSLAGTGFTDTGLARLAPLERLEWLGLGGTRVTDRGLPHLANFPQLRMLDLDGTAISDEGIGSLAVLAELDELSVANTDVTESALRDLGARMPRLSSVWDD